MNNSNRQRYCIGSVNSGDKLIVSGQKSLFKAPKVTYSTIYNFFGGSKSKKLTILRMLLKVETLLQLAARAMARVMKMNRHVTPVLSIELIVFFRMVMLGWS